MPLRAHWRLFWLLAVCLVVPTAAIAAEHIEVSFDGARLEFRLDVLMHAPMADVVAVVHDYERLDRVLPLVVESRLLGPSGDGVERVFTRMRGCLLFFCREAPHTIDVRHVIGGWSSGTTVPDLSRVRRGQFSWRIDEDEADAARSRIRMNGYLEPDFRVPALLGSTLVQWWVRGEFQRSIDRIEHAARTRESPAPPASPR